MGKPGVLHGVRTYILQSPEGQILETHSISAGLDYPGVGPEHAWLKDTGRAEYVVATDEDALRGFRLCTQLEGIIPGTSFSLVMKSIRLKILVEALESSHAVWEAIRLAKTLPQDQDIVLVGTSVSYHLLAKLNFPLCLPSACRDVVTRTSNKFRSFSQENGATFLIGTSLLRSDT